MKILSLLLALPLFASCPGIPQPNPVQGYDCSAQPTFTGMVPVSHAIAGRYIVVLKAKPPAPLRSLLHAAEMGVTDVKPTSRGYAATIAAQALQRVLSNPAVQYVQQDGVKSVAPLASAADLSTPWGLDRSDQRDLPLDGIYAPGSTGEGVNVAVVDTGVTSHPDFADRLQAECFTAHSGVCTDGHGHGTHVSGTVAGKTYGIAKAAKLYAVRVLDSNGSGSDSDVIRGIEWVTAKKHANPSQDWVINMSLGGGDSPALNRATCDAIAAGVVVTVAAGNESADANTSSPARVKQAITVGASDTRDIQATFSNYGVLLDLFAPGVDITSTIPSGGTDTWSGTSMATPHVAGAAALYLQRHPGVSPQTVHDGLVLFATQDHLTLPAQGSPNALLFTREN